jgi:hypothetical protein
MCGHSPLPPAVQCVVIPIGTTTRLTDEAMPSTQCNGSVAKGQQRVHESRCKEVACCWAVQKVSLPVLDPGKGVCADPVERVAILEVKGPGPPGAVRERQLSPDRGG